VYSGICPGCLGNSFQCFLSQIVRIQSERGHTVVTGGPYRYVRHPAYGGAIVYELAISVLLASWWAVVTSVLSITLLILRTVLEDRVLLTELNGYPDYARQVRFRLFPAYGNQVDEVQPNRRAPTD